MLRHVDHQLGFKFVLVHDQQIAIRAEAAMYVLRQQMHWIDVHHQHELALLVQLPAVGTAREALIRVRVEDKPVTRRQVAEAARRRLA